MADTKLIAIIASGRSFTLRLPTNEMPDHALDFLTGRQHKGDPVKPTSLGWEWLDTEEGFRIRRDAIVALVVVEKQGECAVAA